MTAARAAATTTNIPAEAAVRVALDCPDDAAEGADSDAAEVADGLELPVAEYAAAAS